MVDCNHLGNVGILLTLISIPLRYMHSGSEAGVKHIIDLIAWFLVNLEESRNKSYYQNVLSCFFKKMIKIACKSREMMILYTSGNE